MLIDNPRLNEITGSVIGAAIEVHRVLGPGLLESIYTPCLEFELAARNLRFVSQRPVPVVYKSLELAGTYRIDLIVEDSVVVELKSTDGIAPVQKAQVLTYLRLTGCPLGLLINFNSPRLVDGVKRFAHPEAKLS